MILTTDYHSYQVSNFSFQDELLKKTPIEQFLWRGELTKETKSDWNIVFLHDYI